MKKKAVFLDRDGVINEEVHHLKDVSVFRLLPGAGEAIKALKAKGYLVIAITNQAAIAKGMLTEEALATIHAEMEEALAAHGAFLDAIYYCPHHPEGIVPHYTRVCDCRKPGTGMVTDAIKTFNIDPAVSFLVGDKTSDILAGARAGLTTILVKTGYGGKDAAYRVTPDFTVDTILGAVAIIS